MPGARTRGLQAGTIWLLNSSDEPTTATVAPLSDGNEVNTSHVLEPGRLTLVAITGEDSLGFVVSAPDPITVGWSLELPGKVAYAPALLVPDE